MSAGVNACGCMYCDFLYWRMSRHKKDPVTSAVLVGLLRKHLTAENAKAKGQLNLNLKLEGHK